MRLFHLALLPFALLGCAGTADDADDDTEVDDTEVEDTDDTEVDDTDVGDSDTETDPGDAAPNAKAVGTWDLVAATTCTMSFAGEWDGTASSENDLAFTITNRGDATQFLDCVFDAVTPTSFTCSNFSSGGMIPPTCTVSLAITGVTGTVSGDAASLSASIQVTSPNCAEALNCGPLPHTASGTIAP